jgi:hypothetical protein
MLWQVRQRKNGGEAQGPSLVERALLREGKLVFRGKNVDTSRDARRPQGPQSAGSHTSGFFNAQLTGVHTADYAIAFHVHSPLILNL